MKKIILCFVCGLGVTVFPACETEHEVTTTTTEERVVQPAVVPAATTTTTTTQRAAY